MAEVLLLLLALASGHPEATPATAQLQAEQAQLRAAAAERSANRVTRNADRVPHPWAALAACESDSRWSYNGPSGYDGGLQFHPNTWAAYRPASYPPAAWQATPAQQVAVAERVLAAQGWGAWPACSAHLGLR